MKVIEVNGVALPTRSALNVIGTGVSGADNPGNDSTDVTITGGGGGGSVTGTGLWWSASGTLLAGAVNFSGDGTLGSASGSTVPFTLTASGAAAGTYGDATHVSQVTVDAKGRVTAASSVAITGSGGGWTTAFDLDFTAQTTATLSTDGNYTIGGLTWTKGNSSSDATAMQLTNGTGLTIRPISASDMGGGPSNTTAPFLWTPLSGLGLSSYDWQTSLRILLSIGSENGAADFDFTGIALCTQPVPGTGIALGFIEYYGHSSSAHVAQLAYFVNKTRAGLANFKINTQKTILFSVDQLAATSMQTFEAAALSAGAAFPAPNTFDPTGRETGLADINASGAVATSLGILICAARAGSATAFAPVIQRLRVDTRP